MIRRATTALLLAALPFPALASPVRVGVPLPPTPAGTAVIGGPLGGTAYAEPQSVHPGAAVQPAWWHAFANPTLDALVDKALAANADISAATANLRQAHELAGAARGVLFPQVDAGYSVERQRVSGTLSSPLVDPLPAVFSLHTAQVSIAYSLDLFGGNAAHIRSARAAERATAARLQGVRNIVSGNVVLAVIQNAGLEAQAATTRAAIDSNRTILRLLKAREALGAAGKSDVAAQEAALAAAEAALPPIERARLANLASLDVLLGQAPGSALPALPSLDDLTLPGELPLSLSSDLLVQRPDIAAAAEAMEGAAADAKAAMAARLPSITLSAAAGGAARDFGQMFRDGNPFWTLIGGLAAPLFHGGALRHQQKAAEAALDGAKAGYRAVALQAFADVSNALGALTSDAATLDAAARADKAAQDSLGFTKRKLELGSAGTFDVLNAGAMAQAARSQFFAARTMRLSDTVGLFTALGGGVSLRGGAPQ
ncbi:efflux transporter outer membrane subunit [Novosphingobium sp. KCTC 2891]|uniref:efflux transporter outer membrane subunit n=1 Tax=Novosphingobium sp. KCTC 2891 TaxID=2989730 RepID=UPI0022238387|nr:efflux transporter outer membrane subunit [Novosphingobium sp. KCTC 2891]MCW1381888.1 efflux transporter outer membrane subunit [Novosphingobium sp. KCTC 2891]